MNHEQGSVLICSHGDYSCRVRIEVECHCDNAGGEYDVSAPCRWWRSPNRQRRRYTIN
jgi:hypothetical protein